MINEGAEAFKKYIETELNKVVEVALKEMETIEKDTENLVNVIKHHMESQK